jgi:L-lactate dehydrogenase complex protein LldG
MTAARTAVLSALRAGLSAAPLAVPSAPPRPASVPVGADAWAVLAEALAPLDVRVRTAATPRAAAAHVADIARERACASYTRWEAGFEDLPEGFAAGLDAALAGLDRAAAGHCADLAKVDLGVAVAQAALLESGSLVLVAGAGRHRAASLLPPASVVLVRKSALLPDVSHLPELLARRREGGRLPACVNLVTGPSSTADIELVLVRGVHGPGSLDVVGLDF